MLEFLRNMAATAQSNPARLEKEIAGRTSGQLIPVV